MLLSMTGFGRAVSEYKNKKIIIDVKSLNSKTLDVNTRIPSCFKEKEIEIRRLLSQELQRGKIDFCINIESAGTEVSDQLNGDLVVSYYNRIKDICSNNSIPFGNETLSAILRLPDVFKNNVEDLKEDDWGLVLDIIKKAINSCIEFRLEEGKMLEKDILLKNKSILELLSNVPQYEHERISTIKERLKQNVTEGIGSNNVDSNRYEQEVIYYLEKLDINEEKVRLKKHCEYLVETINSEEFAGKKLGFIAQEIGREINTLGSKAHHVEIQKNVVMMKDELEKIKEQLLNVL